MMSIPNLRALPERRAGLAGALLLGLLALALRVWGVRWSLPYVDHPDEPAVLDVALRVVQGQLNPDSFFYPSLMYYLFALTAKLHFWWGLQQELYVAPLQLPDSNHFYTSIPGAFVWGRTLTAAMGAATVVALGAWGARYVGWRAALLGAALLASSAWAVQHAHYLAVDIPAACTATLALLAALRVLRRGSYGDYLLAGALAGLGAGTKYQVVLVLGSLGLAHVLRWRWRSLSHAPRLVVAGLVCVLVFLAVSPYIVLDFAAFRRDLQTLFSSYDGSHGDVTGAWPLTAYLSFFWHTALGPLQALLLLAGAVALGRRDPALLAVLLSFPLLLVLVLLRVETHFLRNLLPLQPALLLLAGCGAVALWDAARPRLPARARLPLAALGLLVLLGPTLVAAARRSADFARPDSRVAAQEWARREHPGVRIASELSHPLRWSGIAQSEQAHYLPLHPMAWYREQGYGLLLASSDTRRSWDWTADYQPLLAEGQVVASYGGQDSPYRGPRIELIDTGLSAGSLPFSAPQASIGPLRLLGVGIGSRSDKETGPEREYGRQLRPGAVLAVTAFWLADQPVSPADYVVFVHVRNQQGQTVVQRDLPPWGGLFPPHSWRPGTLVAESLDLWLPTSLPSGSYQLVLGMYDSAREMRFVASAGGAQLPHDEVDLGLIEVQP